MDDGQDPEERKKKLAAELANGRLAMMAIIGRSTRENGRGCYMKMADDDSR